MSRFYRRVLYGRVQEFKCSNCGTFCQGFSGPDGRLLCADCYKKAWGKWPWD